MYSLGASEEILGRALRDFGPGRDRVVIATKVFNAMGDDPNQRGLSRKHIRHAIDDSLRRLGTDYVDLYQIHRFDPSTPVEETMEALDDLVRAGKVLHVGASSMWAWQLAQDAPRGRGARLGAVRHDAESLQPHLPRGGAGDGPALRRQVDRPPAVEPACARIPGARPWAATVRTRTDEYARHIYGACCPDPTWPSTGRREGRVGPGRPPRTGRSGVGLPAARCRGADRRRLEGPPP
jgi:hypothetical protein